MSETFDYIVIGAGSAGCPVANRLSEDQKNRVLLLEAGPKDRNIWIHIPIGYYRTMTSPLSWGYYTEPEEGIAGRSLIWPRGKVLGGSSAINGLVYVRGQKQDYDHWRQLGNEGWGFDDVLPFFKMAEDQERGDDDYHGRGGPLKVSDIRDKREICDAFIAAAKEAGIPENTDFNGADQEGVGHFQTTSHNGWRCSTAVGYLKPIRNRSNLRIETDAQVHFIPFSATKLGGDLHPYSGVTASVCQLRPESRGEVMVRSPDPLEHPRITPNYLSTEYDRRIMVEGLKMVRRIAQAPAFAKYVATEREPGAENVSDEALLTHAREKGSCSSTLTTMPDG